MRGFDRSNVGAYLGITIGTALLVAGALHASIQVTLVTLGLITAVILRSRRRTLTFALILIPTTGLIRRLVAGPNAHAETDPLLILPILLVVAVLVTSLGRSREQSRWSFARGAILASVAGIVATIVVTTSFDIQVLFDAGLMVVSLLLAITISSGRVPSPWATAVRILPPLAVLVGLYGIYQFFYLPRWDKAWMISSQLTSIGHPYPLQVRVFGASESPGPYALFVGLCLTICLFIAVMGRTGAKRLPWMAVCIFLAVPLVLSGVRSALIGVVISGVLLALLRAKGITRILIIAFFGGMYFVLTTVVAKFGATSTILNADRYTQFSSNDASLTARLRLLNDLRNPLQHIVGNPNAPGADNLFIDSLTRFGIVAAVGLFSATVWMLIVSIRNLLKRQNEIAALCFIFVATQSIFGNIFGSLSGLLVGVVIGAAMRLELPPSRPAASIRQARQNEKLDNSPRGTSSHPRHVTNH